MSSPSSVLVSGRDPLDPGDPREFGEIHANGEDLFRYYEAKRGHALNVLLLSGGGQNGAFGAGLLKGWRKAGTRPQFDMVTGVSTGALLATHAFLGTEADDVVLEALFTSVTRDSIYKSRGAISVLAGADSLMSTEPLQELVDKHITAEVLERVAAEHVKGRRLLVGTTNLDYNQTWAWNLGLIATRGGPEALELYRSVLTASSAFPVMFPPIEIDGHYFADGAVRANLLVLGLSGERIPGPPLHGPGTVWVVQNGKVEDTPAALRPNLFGVASVSLGQMMSSSMEGLLLRAYFAAQVHQYEFRMVSIPGDVDTGSNPLAFEPTEMANAFNAGYDMGLQPDPWKDTPPIIGDFPEWALELIKERL